MNYLDLVALRSLAARVLQVDEQAVDRMTPGETMERILLSPTRIVPTRGESEIARRGAALAYAILIEQPIPQHNDHLAAVALAEFVRLNGHDIGAVEHGPETLSHLLAHQTDEVELASWIATQLDPAAQRDSR